MRLSVAAVVVRVRWRIARRRARRRAATPSCSIQLAIAPLRGDALPARRCRPSTGPRRPTTPALAHPGAQGQGAHGAQGGRVRPGAAGSREAGGAGASPTPKPRRCYGDALWSAGLFDEADRGYETALALAPAIPRARFGLARSLATSSKLDEALDEALAASADAPRDGEIHAAIGDIYERLNRFDEAANSYTNYINLLPNKDRSDKAAWARAQVRVPRVVRGR